MVVEAVRTYFNLVNGLSKAAREQAWSAAYGLLTDAGLEDLAKDAEQRVGRLTEEVRGAGRANRELVENLITAEVGRAAGRLGFVCSDDLDEVREEIAELRAQLAREKAGTATSAATRAATSAATKAPRKKAAAPRAPGAGRASSTRPGAAQQLAKTKTKAKAKAEAKAEGGGEGQARPAARTSTAAVPDPAADAGA